MAEVSLTAAFSSVPGDEAEAIKRLLVETVEQIARDDKTFSRARRTAECRRRYFPRTRRK